MRVFFNGQRYLGDLDDNVTLILLCTRIDDFVQVGERKYTLKELGYYRLSVVDSKIKLRHLGPYHERF